MTKPQWITWIEKKASSIEAELNAFTQLTSRFMSKEQIDRVLMLKGQNQLLKELIELVRAMPD